MVSYFVKPILKGSIMNNTSLIAEFDNKNLLTLKLKSFAYEGFVPVSFYVLSYSEYNPNAREKGLDPKRIEGDYFTVYSEEYFPSSMIDSVKSAFNIRLNCNNPMHESDMGYSLNQLLNKK